MNDKNGNSAEDWKRASNRIQHWSQIYKSKYQNNGIATGNAMNSYGQGQYSGYGGVPSKHNLQTLNNENTPQLNFTIIAVVSSIFGIVFFILFGWQCTRSSCKYWKLREYDTIGATKSKVIYIGEKSACV